MGSSAIVPAAMRFSVCHSTPATNVNVLFAKPVIHRPRTSKMRGAGAWTYPATHHKLPSQTSGVVMSSTVSARCEEQHAACFERAYPHKKTNSSHANGEVSGPTTVTVGQPITQEDVTVELVVRTGLSAFSTLRHKVRNIRRLSEWFKLLSRCPRAVTLTRLAFRPLKGRRDN